MSLKRLIDELIITGVRFTKFFFFWTALLASFATSGFFTFKLYNFFFVSKTNNTGQINGVSGEVILSLLAIVLTFASLISYLFYKVVQESIKKEIEIGREKERNASRLEMLSTISYIFGEIYSNDKKNFPNFLEKTIENNEFAMEYIRGLDKEENGKVIYGFKNNFAYDLAERQKERTRQGKCVDLGSKEKALKLAEELWRIVKKGEYLKHTKEPYRWEETYAWVIWNFAETKEERQKALHIIKSLEGRVPFEWYLKIKRKYKI